MIDVFLLLYLIGLAIHYATEHEMLKNFMALPELVQRKRDENRGYFSSSRPTSISKFVCMLCYETLDAGTHNKALDHFSLHIWCDHRDILNRKSLPGTFNRDRNNAPIKMEDKYGLNAWLSHHKIILKDSFAEVSKVLKVKFSRRVTDITRETWCCLCQDNFSPSGFLQHYTAHFQPLAITEITNWGLTCKECKSPNNEFLTFGKLKHHYIEKHFKSKVRSVIADIPDVPKILQLRKEMNVSSITNLNLPDNIIMNHKSTKSEFKNHETASEMISCSEKPMSFLQNLATIYGSELVKQTSEYSYSTATGIAKDKCDNSTSNTSIRHNHTRILSPTTMTKQLLVNNSSQNERGKTQCDSVSIHTGVERKNLNKYAPHKWLCNGRLLLLLDPLHPKNIDLFKSQWQLGQPVLIANSSSHLNHKLWHPRAFLKDFGHLRHDLVNCLTGQTVPKAPLHKFWQGFTRIKDRLKDSDDTPMLLKLKDWPPTSDIADYMPKRFQDLFSAFPMKIYTKREGELNLAGYLPELCLKPELGPKMYIAYGSALYSGKASTNLHIDMSDAVNCLVYVGLPDDGDAKETAKQVLREIDKAGCDILMKRRVRRNRELPGALWHIFHPMHTSAIRNFLNQVALEKGKRLDPHDDPIHDQSTYLTAELRMRLYKEYGIQGN